MGRECPVSFKNSVSGLGFAELFYVRDVVVYHRLYETFEINEQVRLAFDKEWKRISQRTNCRRMAGVVLRGTDYLSLKPSHHPIQPELGEVFEEIDKNIDKNTLLYLATECEEYAREMVSRYGDRVILPNQKFLDKEFNSDKNITHIGSVKYEGSRFERGIEYLRSIYVLSRCDYLIGGNCGASRMALIMNGGKYDGIQIFDKGYYL